MCDSCPEVTPVSPKKMEISANRLKKNPKIFGQTKMVFEITETVQPYMIAYQFHKRFFKFHTAQHFFWFLIPCLKGITEHFSFLALLFTCNKSVGLFNKEHKSDSGLLEHSGVKRLTSICSFAHLQI